MAVLVAKGVAEAAGLVGEGAAADGGLADVTWGRGDTLAVAVNAFATNVVIFNVSGGLTLINCVQALTRTTVHRTIKSLEIRLAGPIQHLSIQNAP